MLMPCSFACTFAAHAHHGMAVDAHLRMPQHIHCVQFAVCMAPWRLALCAACGLAHQDASRCAHGTLLQQCSSVVLFALVAAWRLAQPRGSIAALLALFEAWHPASLHGTLRTAWRLAQPCGFPLRCCTICSAQPCDNTVLCVTSLTCTVCIARHPRALLGTLRSWCQAQ